jgi:trimeric autotransporter adhesin
MGASRSLLLMVVGALGVASNAAAQCDAWISSPSSHAAFRGYIGQVASWAPPGSGGIPRLYAGGTQLEYFGAPLGTVASWNGSIWQAVPGAPNGPIRAVVVWNSPSGPVLVVGGEFSQAGSPPSSVRSLAAWNGTSWSGVGNGVSRMIAPGVFQDGEIEAMAVWDPDGPGPLGQRLVVGGNFTYAGNSVPNTHNLAAWDGTSWHAFGLGIDQPDVRSITAWHPNGAGGQPQHLIVAGAFQSASNVICNGIARWTNGSWWPIAGGVSHATETAVVQSVAVLPLGNNAPVPFVLAIAGHFDHAGTVAAHGFALWNGAVWGPMNTQPGTSGIAIGIHYPEGVSTLPRLIGSGTFTTAGGGTLTSPRLWDNNSWMSKGNFGPTLARNFVDWDPDGVSGPLPAVLVAGGTLHQTPAGLAFGVSRLDGPNWSTFGATPQVFATTPFASTRLAVGGSFDMISEGTGGSLGHARHLATWDGAAKRSLGELNGAVRALKSYSTSGAAGGDHLVVGGAFTAIGTSSAPRIARWYEPRFTGTQGWVPMGAGFNSTVLAIERFNNEIYAGGVFTNSGGTTVNRIARFDGSSWQAMGGGANEAVRALKAYNGSLYVGGSFTSAGGLSSGGLARWNGTSWSIVGGNFLGTVHALEVWNNLLIIGGAFQGLNAPCIAAYNGTSYSNLGSGGTGSTGSPVYAIAAGPDGNLYVAGSFTSIGGVNAVNVARWNGATWSAVSGGVSGGPALALAAFKNEIHAGGEFTHSAGITAAAPAWARYTVDGVPWIARQPANVSALCAGAEPVLQSWAAPGYTHAPPVTGTWSKDGNPVSPGPTPWGSTISIFSVGMRIFNVQQQDAGSYTYTFSNACGSETSNAATISVCYANCDCSSVLPILNVADFSCFLQRFAAGHPYANCDLSTTAPTLNVADFTCFLTKFAAGCP